MFQYHDEALAASSKLEEKVNEVVAKQRLKKLSKILDEIYEKHAKAARGKTFSGYIMSFDDKKIIVRREIQAPEVDEYDEVKISALAGKVKNLDVGQFVTYKL